MKCRLYLVLLMACLVNCVYAQGFDSAIDKDMYIRNVVSRHMYDYESINDCCYELITTSIAIMKDPQYALWYKDLARKFKEYDNEISVFVESDSEARLASVLACGYLLSYGSQIEPDFEYKDYLFSRFCTFCNGFSSIQDPNVEFMLLNVKGNVYASMDEYSKAIELFHSAVSIA